MQGNDFNEENALEAARALTEVLEARTHRKKVMGQVVTIPGQLGEALKLPTIINRLQSKMTRRREQGLENFAHLWDTLSEPTRREVLRRIGWYDPDELDWEDPRSNRRPRTITDA